MIFGVANPAVTRHNFLLPRYLHEWHEIFVQVHFNQDGNENFKRLIYFSLNKSPYCILFSASTDLHSFFVRFFHPAPLLHFCIVGDNILVFFLHLSDKLEIFLFRL